jgi:hypothetical protein
MSSNLPTKILIDGREASVTLLTYGRARLHVGQPGGMCYDNEW